MNRRLLAITPVDHPGGAETTLLRLLSGLHANGWAITVTTPGGGPLREQARSAGYRWHPLPVGGLARGTGVKAMRSWPRARQLAREADVVYLNGGVCGRLLPALAPSRRRHRPRLVLHIHDMVARVPRFWRWADLVLADSAAVAARLEGLTTEIVYCPVDPDPPPEKPPWPTANGPVVGFVGRLEPRKGPLDLVRAAARIRRDAPGARVVMVGDEPYGTAPDYTREVRESAEIEHHGWTAGAPSLMRHLDVLVLPSYEEPFGTVLAEAMAVGTPVVATRVDGLPEVVRDGITGRLVEPGDPEGLAQAVLEVLARKQEMGAAAREHAQRFHLGGYVEHVERLLAP
jgi:glycosyltransferase involved in cell wall biosynthesis